MKYIKLSNYNKSFIVDDEDYENVKYYSWNLNGGENTVIQGWVNNKCVSIGRFLLGESNLEADHKDCNIFNNQKSNLRNATRAQNAINKPFNYTNNSGYKGVSFYKPSSKWRARIKVDQKEIHLGHFNDIIDAAKAYNEAALKYFGEFAWLNKIPEMENSVK